MPGYPVEGALPLCERRSRAFDWRCVVIIFWLNIYFQLHIFFIIRLGERFGIGQQLNGRSRGIMVASG